MNKTALALQIVAILSISAIEIIALLHQINGYTLSLAVAAISGIAGFNLKTILAHLPPPRRKPPDP